MDEIISIERTENGQPGCVFYVRQKEDVNILTVKMIEAGFDVLYEPSNRAAGYESCIICGDRAYIRIVASGSR